MFRRVRYSSARQTTTKLYASPPLTSRAYQSRTRNTVSELSQCDTLVRPLAPRDLTRKFNRSDWPMFSLHDIN